ncbi:amidohydrolase family protein [Roseomonas alkaliterrae]|uniref:Putative TIM-barrel fold metal-dependent hydrolase n=1 Tax=Neoroseomonas alkaliterrae TaxID=1452450 RepID=A0A840XN76_9PROT|nr:amidohydrolase family protein [Neoroseomonas alkaliterrae]MBB5690035.1 putative TIM-barrel fold metal-dependent hydrolase [Neoroseomonas alkaliterrae]MBR0676754.1 amidohydrolase family protein [Neoroseomonas alkaliterrae]
MRPCLPPLDAVPKPSWVAPPLSCDCHFHIFGPYDRFPLDPGRHYDPPAALIPAYLRVAEALGIQRMVIVQPSVYGTDNACSLDAAARFGLDRARVVAVVDEGLDDAALRALHTRGVRGVRFNAVSGNGTPLDQLEALARRIAPLGWHLQLYAEGHQLPDLAPRLASLPVEVVVDHMGGVRTADGLNAPAFQALLRLVGEGRAWVKLCGYRISSAGPPFHDVAPFARALLDAAPDRCVWGTDWPHPSLSAWMPDDGVLLDRLGEWAPSAAERRRVLVDNPARLYGF